MALGRQAALGHVGGVRAEVDPAAQRPVAQWKRGEDVGEVARSPLTPHRGRAGRRGGRRSVTPHRPRRRRRRRPASGAGTGTTDRARGRPRRAGRPARHTGAATELIPSRYSSIAHSVPRLAIALMRRRSTAGLVVVRTPTASSGPARYSSRRPRTRWRGRRDQKARRGRGCARRSSHESAPAGRRRPGRRTACPGRRGRTVRLPRPVCSASSTSTGRATVISPRPGAALPAISTTRSPTQYSVPVDDCSTAPRSYIVESSRDTVLFGRSTRSATSDTPAAPPDKQRRMAKARSTDCTPATQSSVPQCGTVPQHGPAWRRSSTTPSAVLQASTADVGAGSAGREDHVLRPARLRPRVPGHAAGARRPRRRPRGHRRHDRRLPAQDWRRWAWRPSTSG